MDCCGLEFSDYGKSFKCAALQKCILNRSHPLTIILIENRHEVDSASIYSPAKSELNGSIMHELIVISLRLLMLSTKI